MKWCFLFITVALFSSGCSSLEETYFLDREYGTAQMETWDKMIAQPDSEYADKAPEGMEGINAEPTMEIYQKSFAKPPTKTNVINLGIIGK